MPEVNRMYTRVYDVTLAALLLGLTACTQPVDEPPPSVNEIAAATKTVGLDYTPGEMALMRQDLAGFRDNYRALRQVGYPNSLPPVLDFSPRFAAAEISLLTSEWNFPSAEMPRERRHLAYYSVAQLGALLRSREISSLELTRLFLDRLEKYDPQLRLVITTLKNRALDQARKADMEIAAGNYRGPLHGIPWVAKDLLALRGYPTTWGAAPFREQMLDEMATVIQRLDDAGAVLLAKVSLGALAWGDVWFGGQTRNPWNTEQGSSGSSAGSAASVSAGLAPFAIGSETWGSIISPATRVGVSGLRPTFGRVSRHGAMALSWSMDKIGPLCRDARDCALVLSVLHGKDDNDPLARDVPFNFVTQPDLKNLRIGYLVDDFASDYVAAENDLQSIETLRQLGAELVPLRLPDLPIRAMAFVLSAEAAAAFDNMTRSNRDDLLTRQQQRAWPNVFRAAQLIPAVEYIQANRLRRILIDEIEQMLSGVDLYVAPSLEGENLLATNLTGHPAVVVPNGFNPEGLPTSITLIGKPFDEARLLETADVYQRTTGFHKIHPPGFE